MQWNGTQSSRLIAHTCKWQCLYRHVRSFIWCFHKSLTDVESLLLFVCVFPSCLGFMPSMLVPSIPRFCNWFALTDVSVLFTEWKKCLLKFLKRRIAALAPKFLNVPSENCNKERITGSFHTWGSTLRHRPYVVTEADASCLLCARPFACV